MAITVGILRGGTNNHETTSTEANSYATDFVSEGIVSSVGNTGGVAPATGGFSVNAQGTPDMTVAVDAGTAYVTGTPSSQGSQTFRVVNSASANVTISANSSGSTKYDWIYISLSAANLNEPAVGADDVATLVASRSSSATTDDGTPPTYGYALAVVTVANGASSISNGSIRDLRAQTELNTGTSNAVSGWNSFAGAFTTATGYNSGNRSFTIDTTTDQTAVVSEGMRAKFTRAVTPPTQCADLEASSSQYASNASPTGITFTDDFTCEAWVKLESYTGSNMAIVSRQSSTGWILTITASGTVQIYGRGSGTDTATTYQSVPLSKWVHIAATLDMSGGVGTIYLDGVEVPSVPSSAASTLTQAGNLEVGSFAGSNFFDGKLADVRVWSDIRDADEIRDNMYAYPSDTTGLVAHFKLNGDFTDSSTNGNDLTASGGAVATNVDNPWNATEYGIITAVSASDIQVFCPQGYGIPNETLTAPFYSTQSAPFGFPRDKGLWKIQVLGGTQETQTVAANTPELLVGFEIAVPVGSWEIGYSGAVYHDNGGSASMYSVFFGLSADASGATFTNGELISNALIRTSTTSSQRHTVGRETQINLPTSDIYYAITGSEAGTAPITTGIVGNVASNNYTGGVFSIYAKCAYL